MNLRRTTMLTTGLLAATFGALGGWGQPTGNGRTPEAPRPPLAESAMLRAATDPEQEVNAALDDFHDAAAKADFHRYFSHWTAASVFLGTDATERWVGDQFRDYARPHFEQGHGWTYRPHDRHITVGGDGDRAFFDELLDNDKLGLCRGSGVVKKYGGEWKVLQYNLSIPIPNDKAERVAALVRAEPPAAPATDEKHKE